MDRISVEEYKKQIMPPEEDDQIALAQILDQTLYNGRQLKWIHCPNEGNRKPQYTAKLRRMGLKPGFPDVIIFDSPPNYPSLKGGVIELKRKKGGVISEAQQDWVEYFRTNGWDAWICKGLDEAIDILKHWGYIK